MTTLEDGAIPEQHNHGSGTLIGRDNYGSIEVMDPKTKALLEKMTKQAPALGRLLNKALQDGMISPDTVATLERAAWSINEDVVNTLAIATRNLNEDVANSLHAAADKIDSDAIRRIENAASTIDNTANQINSAVSMLDNAAAQIAKVEFADDIQQLNSISSVLAKQASRVKRVVTPPPPVEVTNRRAIIWAFFIGVVLGAALVAWAINR